MGTDDDLSCGNLHNSDDCYLTYLLNRDTITSDMRETMIEKKKLVCDVCDREDGAKSEWEGTIKVWNWGNEHDHGTICDECQEDMIDNQ